LGFGYGQRHIWSCSEVEVLKISLFLQFVIQVKYAQFALLYCHIESFALFLRKLRAETELVCTYILNLLYSVLITIHTQEQVILLFLIRWNYISTRTISRAKSAGKERFVFCVVGMHNTGIRAVSASDPMNCTNRLIMSNMEALSWPLFTSAFNHPSLANALWNLQNNPETIQSCPCIVSSDVHDQTTLVGKV
jgi:hypothetical protein